MPGQTVNIDLCFVPTTRTADQAIPAVSGSSGRLIVQTSPAARSTTFPGAVFATPDQPYAEQMQAYTAAANHRYGWRSKPTTVPDPIRQQRIELRHHATLLQAARRATRLQRGEEDRAWMQLLTTRGTVADRQRQYQHAIDRAMTPAQRRVERQRMWGFSTGCPERVLRTSVSFNTWHRRRCIPILRSTDLLVKIAIDSRFRDAILAHQGGNRHPIVPLCVEFLDLPRG